MSEFKVTFWGVRGSRPVPGKEVLEYGGNTSCVFVEVGNEKIIIDAGSGISELGKTLETHSPMNLNILISHVHWDHIQGLPFFMPFYNPQNRFTIYGEKKQDRPFKSQIANLMSDPHFPINLSYIEKQVHVKDLVAGDSIPLNHEVEIKSIASYHPNGSVAYAIHYKGKKLCYLVDYEHQDTLSEVLYEWVKDADLLIYDANFTEEEYVGKRGWGHSTWQEGVALSKKAHVKRLGLFHHDPNRSDEDLKSIELEAQKAFEEAFACREGLCIVL